MATHTLSNDKCKAKAQRSSLWFVRVDGNHDYLETKLKDFASKIDVIEICAALHVGEKKDNPHCHFVVKMAGELQKQSYALRIKDHFKITKKTEYALAIWDGEKGAGAVSYLYHEDDARIVLRKGFTDEDLERAKLANDAVQRVVKINNERASTKLPDRAVEHFANSSPNRIEILQWMLSEIQEGNHYHPGEFKIKTFVEEVELKLLKKDDLELYAYNMAKRLWRD